MKFKKSMLYALALGMALPLVACGGGGTSSEAAKSSAAASSAAASSTSKTTSQGGASSTAASSTAASSSSGELVTLNMSIMYKNNIHMKFLTTSDAAKLPYEAADGTVYSNGDFKPVWKALQKKLNFKINDVTSTKDESVAATFKTFVGSTFKAEDKTTDVDITQGNTSDIVTEGTDKGTILDLSQYLTKMPNYSAWLDAHPVVKKMIVDANGKMFYAPYNDGFDDIERMLLIRQDWVEKLLDGTGITGLDTAKTLTSSYTAWGKESVDQDISVLNDAEKGKATVHKGHTANIITTQNALATKNGETLVTALRDYIDATYAGAYGTSRSKLFIGGKAAYDVDELIALYRCVYTNPNFLTGQTAKDVVPLYPRSYTNDRIADLWRFTQMFGVRGGESRTGYLYVGTDGKIHDARGDQAMVDVLEKMNEMYNEGLIQKTFNDKASLSGSKSFSDLLQKDNNLGFSQYDYCQTQTVYDTTSPSKYPGYKFVPTLPAVADWRGDGKLFHYTESWRSIKTEAWCITKQVADNAAKLNKALELFDYLWSEEGNRLMSYGPDGYLKKNSDGTTIATIDYQGKQVPALSDACKAEIKTLASGSYTDYYRKYLGATLPVGYVKEQGMEYQTVSTGADGAAVTALDSINHALEYGVLEHVNFKTDNADHLYDIIPTTFSFTAEENAALSSNFAKLGTTITNDSSGSNVWSNIVISGFGTYTDLDFTKANYLDTVNSAKKLNLTGYVQYYNDAYSRMGL